MGLKNKFETAVINETSVFEVLKFYCIFNSVLFVQGCPNSLSYYGNSNRVINLKHILVTVISTQINHYVCVIKSVTLDCFSTSVTNKFSLL